MLRCILVSLRQHLIVVAVTYEWVDRHSFRDPIQEHIEPDARNGSKCFSTQA